MASRGVCTTSRGAGGTLPRIARVGSCPARRLFSVDDAAPRCASDAAAGAASADLCASCGPPVASDASCATTERTGAFASSAACNDSVDASLGMRAAGACSDSAAEAAALVAAAPKLCSGRHGSNPSSLNVKLRSPVVSAAAIGLGCRRLGCWKLDGSTTSCAGSSAGSGASVTAAGGSTLSASTVSSPTVSRSDGMQRASSDAAADVDESFVPR